MGLITGSFALIFGLILLIFPREMSRFLRLGPSTGIVIRKESNEWKVGMAKSVEHALGEKNAVSFLRILGAISIFLSVFAFLSSEAL